MQRNTLMLLAGGVVLLLFVAFAAGVFDDASTLDLPTLAVEPEAVDSLAVQWPGHALTLVRHPDGWHLRTPRSGRADSTTVANLLRSLAALTPEALATTSPERFARYGIDSTARAVTLYPHDDEPLHLTLGKNGPDFQSIYVRLGDEPRVLLAKGRPAFPTSAEAWRDKTVVHLRPAALQHVEVVTPESSYTLARNENRWLLHRDGSAEAADSAAVARWLNRFAPLRADGFLDDTTAVSIRKAPTHTLTFTLADGSTRRLLGRTFDQHLGLLDEANPSEVYRFYAYRRANLFPEASSLKSGR